MSEEVVSKAPEDMSVLETALEKPAAGVAEINVENLKLADIAELDNIRPVLHDLEGLAATMHLEGQLQPCVVRLAAKGSPHGKKYELIFGYRRKKAAEILEWKTLRCEIRPITNGQKMQQMIIENFQREQLSPVAEARAMYALKFSVTPALTNVEIAGQLGCDPSQISHRLTMLDKLAPAPKPPREIIIDDSAAHRVDEDKKEESDEVSSAPATKSEPREVGDVADIPGRIINPNLDTDDEPEEAVGLDILGLVDSGAISASAAEVIASLEDRADQEKLAGLVVKHDWGVKKTANWANVLKSNQQENAEYELVLTNTAMLEMSDVTPLQRIALREDLTPEDISRLTLFMQLRNGMDYEITNYIEDTFGITFDNLWDYVEKLTAKEVSELSSRMTIRYVTSAHRISTIDASLRAKYENEEIPGDDTDPSDFIEG